MKGSCVEKAKVESTRNPNWLQLPIDLIRNILQRLDTVEIVTSARNVCPLWWNICKDPLMWRTIHISNINVIPLDYHYLHKIYGHAIDLSRGYVEDISLELFGTDDILKYTAPSPRASHLRRLRIKYLVEFSDKRLSEFVKEFPLLEELTITFKNNTVSRDSLEVIGRCCPRLKSLNLWRLIYPCAKYKYNDVAFAIAKTMSGLRHLKLSGIWLKSVELLAILDDCPLLESLDLLGCLCASLSPSLKRRCREQIEDLRPQKYFLQHDCDADE